jgi:hypothetical protein
MGINNCNTKLENKIIGRITNSRIEGCTCCSVTGYDSADLIDTSLDYVDYNIVPSQSEPNYEVEIYDSECNLIGTTIISLRNTSDDPIINLFYPIKGLSGPIVKITGKTSNSPNYVGLTINSPGYFRCGDITVF